MPGGCLSPREMCGLGVFFVLVPAWQWLQNGPIVSAKPKVQQPGPMDTVIVSQRHAFPALMSVYAQWSQLKSFHLCGFSLLP